MRLLPRRRRKTEKLRAAADVSGPSAEEAVARALGDPHPSERFAALAALEERAEPTAVEPLLDAVARWPYPQDYELLEKALNVLVGWSPAGVGEAFARRLLDPAGPELDDRHRDSLAALIAADEHGGAPAAGAVAELALARLAEAEGEAAMRAEQVLAWLGRDAADTVLGALDGAGVDPRVVAVAGRLHDSRALQPIASLMGSPDPSMRAVAATALGELNDTRAVDALIGATQDPEYVVRDAAAEALNGMGVAAVITGVGGVVREAVREQLGSGQAPAPDAAGELSSGDSDSSLPAGPEAAPAVPPTWTQEVLGRLLRRMGG